MNSYLISLKIEILGDVMRCTGALHLHSCGTAANITGDASIAMIVNKKFGKGSKDKKK